MNKFTIDVIAIIKAIPCGNVLSYGQVAVLAGNPKAARQVARILHSMSQKHNLPWHRVIGSSGKISLTGEAGALQLKLLEGEGVVFIDGKLAR